MQGAILEQCSKFERNGLRLLCYVTKTALAVAMFSASGQSEQVRIWLDQLGILRRGSKERLEDSILTTELRLSEILVDIRQDPVAGLLRESGEYAVRFH